MKLYTYLNYMEDLVIDSKGEATFTDSEGKKHTVYSVAHRDWVLRDGTKTEAHMLLIMENGEPTWTCWKAVTGTITE